MDTRHNVSRGTVAAALDGTGRGDAAAEWAAHLAQITHRPLLLVTVFEPGGDIGGAGERAEQLLRQQEDRLRALGFRGRTRIVAASGQPVSTVLAATKDADALVLGRRSARELHGVGTDGAAITMEASIPVIEVPADWEVSAPSHREIVVAVSGSATDSAALSFSFPLASLLRAPLRTLHGWRVADPRWTTPRSGGTTSLDTLERDQAEEQRLSAEAIAGWRERYPDVQAVDTVQRGPAVDLLLEMSGRAQLLVLSGQTGEPGDFAPLTRARMGHVLRPLIRHARCPVAVVH